MMTAKEIDKLFNEMYDAIYVTCDLYNFKEHLDKLKNKYSNLKEILNNKIKPMDEIQLFIDNYRLIDKRYVTGQNLIELDIMDLLIDYGMD